MKVSYTTEFSDAERRAINAYYGRSGKATRQQCKDWIDSCIQNMQNDLDDLIDAEEDKEAATK